MGFQFVDIQQRTPEWQEFRQGKIGASMAPTIMDDNPYQTRLDLWEEIVFGKSREVTPFMQRGIELEPIARACINKHLGCDFKPAVVQSTIHPWHVASLDGFGIFGGQVCVLELKCPTKRYEKDSVPKMYRPQVQHQMKIPKATMALFVNFYAEDDFDIVEEGYDEIYAEKVFSEELAFLSCVEEFRPPESTNRDWIKMSDPEDVRLGNELLGFKTALKALKRKEEALEAEILKRATHNRCEFGDLKVQKIMKKGNIDYKSIEALKEMDLEPYRKAPSEYWRFN